MATPREVLSAENFSTLRGTTAGSALRPERLPLDNGLVLLHNHTAANASVVIRALVRAGSSRETDGQYGIASLTGRMLRQGTES